MKRYSLSAILFCAMLISITFAVIPTSEKGVDETATVPEASEGIDEGRSFFAELPAWDLGFKWKYHRASHIELEPDGYLDLVDVAWYVVSAIETVTCYDGYSALAYNVTIIDGEVSGGGMMQLDEDDDGTPDRDVDITIDSEQSSITGFQWYRVSDLAMMHDYRDIYAEVDASSGPLVKGTAKMYALNSLQASPPEEDYDFPINTGDEWESDYIYHNYIDYRLDLPDWINGIGVEDEENQSVSDSDVHCHSWCNSTVTLDHDYGSYSDCYLVDTQLTFDDGTGKQKFYYYPPAMNFARWRMENMNFAGMVVQESNNDLMEYDVWPVSTDVVSVGPRGRGMAHPGGKIPVLCDFESSQIRFDADVSGEVFTTQDVDGEFLANVSLPEADDNTVMAATVEPAIHDEGSHGLLVKTPEGSIVPKTVRLRSGDLSLDESGITLSETEIMAGEPVRISAKVYNLVDTFIGMNVNVGFYMDYGTGDEVTIGTSTIYGMDHGPGFYRTFSTIWADPIKGNHSITVVVDCDDLIREADEENNVVELGTYYINSRPEAAFTPNRTSVWTYEDVYFDARASADNEGALSDFKWDFGDGASGSSPTMTHNYTDDGIYNVSLTVTDSDSVTDTAFFEIEVKNRLPEIIYTVGYSGKDVGANIGAGDEVTFDASECADMDGTVTTVHWEFGDDDADSYEEKTTYAYGSRDTYTVSLTVTDDDGGISVETFELSVANKLPVIDFTASRKTVPTYTDVTFDASGSRDLDPQGSIEGYEWDFGDGESGTGKVSVHRYEDDGVFVVKLILTDNEGGSSSGTVEINVTNRAPVLSLKPSLDASGENTISLKEGITIDASGSSDMDGTVKSYYFDPGEGTAGDWGSGKTFQHSYSGKGTYTLTVKIRDDDGEVTEESYTIKVVDNNPPTCSIGFKPAKPEVGQKVEFTASPADPDGDPITGFRWDFGVEHGLNGEWLTKDNIVMSLSYDKAGEYTVTLQVRDESGLVSKECSQIVRIYAEGEAPEDHGSSSSELPLLWIGLGIGAAVIVLIVIIVVVSRKGKDEESGGEVNKKDDRPDDHGKERKARKGDGKEDDEGDGETVEVEW